MEAAIVYKRTGSAKRHIEYACLPAIVISPQDQMIGIFVTGCIERVNTDYRMIIRISINKSNCFAKMDRNGEGRKAVFFRNDYPVDAGRLVFCQPWRDERQHQSDAKHSSTRNHENDSPFTLHNDPLSSNRAERIRS